MGSGTLFFPKNLVFLRRLKHQWTKMTFGISPAPEYIQQFVEREIANLPGVQTVTHDIIIYGVKDNVEAAT